MGVVLTTFSLGRRRPFWYTCIMVIDISCHAWLVLKASVVDNPYEQDAPPKKTKTDPHEQQKHQKKELQFVYDSLKICQLLARRYRWEVRSPMPETHGGFARFTWTPFSGGFARFHGATFRAVLFKEDMKLANPVELGWMSWWTTKIRLTTRSLPCPNPLFKYPSLLGGSSHDGRKKVMFQGFFIFKRGL